MPPDVPSIQGATHQSIYVLTHDILNSEIERFISTRVDYYTGDCIEGLEEKIASAGAEIEVMKSNISQCIMMKLRKAEELMVGQDLTIHLVC